MTEEERLLDNVLYFDDSFVTTRLMTPTVAQSELYYDGGATTTGRLHVRPPSSFDLEIGCSPPADVTGVTHALQVLRQDIELIRQELHALQREYINERDNLHG